MSASTMNTIPLPSGAASTACSQGNTLDQYACTWQIQECGQEMLQFKFDPTESAGFLVGRVAHSLKLRVQEFLDEHEIPLSAEEASILTVLAHRKRKERMRPLAGLLGRDATTVSRQIAGLKQRKLVKRKSCPQDGRATVVTITRSGAKLVEHIMPMTIALRKRALKGISAVDSTALDRTLSQMLQNLKQGT